MQIILKCLRFSEEHPPADVGECGVWFLKPAEPAESPTNHCYEQKHSSVLQGIWGFIWFAFMIYVEGKESFSFQFISRVIYAHSRGASGVSEAASPPAPPTPIAQFVFAP